MSYLFSAFVDRIVDEAPPLDEGQRAAIASALAGHMPAPDVTGRAA